MTGRTSKVVESITTNSRCQFSVPISRVNFIGVILEFMANSAVRGVPECGLAHHPGAVNHILTRLELNGISVEVINGAVIKQFCSTTACVVMSRRHQPVSSPGQVSHLSENHEVRSIPGPIGKNSLTRQP